MALVQSGREWDLPQAGERFGEGERPGPFLGQAQEHFSLAAADPGGGVQRIDTGIKAVREQYAEKDAEAAEADIAERNVALDVPLNLRIAKNLDARLCRQATGGQIRTSALVRRLRTRAVHQQRLGGLTEVKVEEIARRVVRDQSVSS